MKNLFLFFIVLTLNAFSQINLSINVVNKENLSPLSDAKVIVSDDNKTFKKLLTDEQGSCQVIGLAKGNYKIEVSRLGYWTNFLEIELAKDTLIKFELKPKHFLLDEIKVISTKFEKNLKDESIPIVIVDENRISSIPKLTVSDYLKDEPGLSLVRDGIWGTGISIRGLSRANVIVLIDGTRVETATDIAANMSLIDPSKIEKIEVIKGTGSLLYGTGALGGAVNILTKKGSFSDRLKLNTNYSVSYNSVNNNTNNFLRLNLSDRSWFLDIDGGIRNSSDVNTPKGTLKNSRFHDYNYNLNFGLSLFDNQFFKLTFQNYQGKDIGIPGASSLFPATADVRYPTEHRYLFSVDYAFNNLNELLNSIYLKYSFQEIYRDVENIPNQKVIQPKRVIYNTKITPNAFHFTHSLNLTTSWTFSENNIGLIGFDIWQRRLDSRRERYQTIVDTLTSSIKITEKITGERPLPESKFTSLGAFIQDDWKIFDGRLFLNSGLRVDRILIENKQVYNPVYEIINGVRNDNPVSKLNWTSRNIQEWSWSAIFSALYRLTDYLDINYTISRSFRSPSLEERFQYIDLGSIVRLGNPDLKPEESFSNDLGFKLYSRDDLFFQVNFFVNYLDNLVVENPEIIIYEGRQARQKQNVGKAILFGFDLNLDSYLTRWLNFYLKGSFVRGEDRETKQPLPQIPPLNIRTGLRYFFLDYFNIDLSRSIVFEQNKVAAGEIPTPGYSVWDVTFGSKPFKVYYFNCSLFFGVENIFNKEYRNHLSTNRGLIDVEPGRNIFIKINLSGF